MIGCCGGHSLYCQNRMVGASDDSGAAATAAVAGMDSGLQRLADYARAIGAAPDDVVDGWLTFMLDGSKGAVGIKDCGTRLSGYIELEQPGDGFGEWLAGQSQLPALGAFRWSYGDELHQEHLVFEFERALNDELGRDDPIARELRAYKAAWGRRRNVGPSAVQRMGGDPRELEPQQAWLVIGDDASWPTNEELDEQAELGAVGIFESVWTAAKQTQPGDLLLFYFMGSRKAVHFVARAASPAFYDAERGVNSIGSPSDHQWWVFHTPLVPVVPIPFKRLELASGGHLILRGRSGKFLRPETVRALSIGPAEDAYREETDEVVRIPTGRADLPAPGETDLSTVSSLAAGALRTGERRLHPHRATTASTRADRHQVRRAGGGPDRAQARGLRCARPRPAGVRGGGEACDRRASGTPIARRASDTRLRGEGRMCIGPDRLEQALAVRAGVVDGATDDHAQ
jgi:hypothetical protein